MSTVDFNDKLSKSKLKERRKSSSSQRDLHSVSSKKSFTTINETFETKFCKFCLENNCEFVPKVKNAKEYTSIIRVSKNEKQILISPSENFEKTLEFLEVKKWRLDYGILNSLGQCFQFYNVYILRLEYCNLDANHIRTLTKILGDNKSISQLSLSGNPNNEQNFYLVLQNSNILYLSLRFCEIDKIGTELISKQLCAPYSSKLMYLNVSSNKIRDEGAVHIAKILRINRILQGLNIADNKISDIGFAHIINALQKFPLSHEELVQKRTEKFKLLKAIEIPSIDKSKSSKNVTKKDSKIEKSLKKNLKDKTSGVSRSSVKLSKSSSIFEVKMEASNHPFIIDCWEDNKEIYCKGNYTLVHLNLGYNGISELGFTSILEMLQYQKLTFDDKGISHLVLSGNASKQSSVEASIFEALSNKFVETPLSSKESLPSISSNRKRRASSSKMMSN